MGEVDLYEDGAGTLFLVYASKAWVSTDLSGRTFEIDAQSLLDGSADIETANMIEGDALQDVLDPESATQIASFTIASFTIEDGIRPTGRPNDAGRHYLGYDADVFEPLVTRLAKIYDEAVGVGSGWAEGRADTFNAWVESYFCEDSIPWEHLPEFAYAESQCGGGSEGVHWYVLGDRVLGALTVGGHYRIAVDDLRQMPRVKDYKEISEGSDEEDGEAD
jgi:hypothetical protein